jgi:hypothetical protein
MHSGVSVVIGRPVAALFLRGMTAAFVLFGTPCNFRRIGRSSTELSNCHANLGAGRKVTTTKGRERSGPRFHFYSQYKQVTLQIPSLFWSWIFLDIIK